MNNEHDNLRRIAELARTLIPEIEGAVSIRRQLVEFAEGDVRGLEAETRSGKTRKDRELAAEYLTRKQLELIDRKAEHARLVALFDELRLRLEQMSDPT